MKNVKEKFNKIKELYGKYKEAKKDPRKRAGMKLLGYFIFFAIFLLIAAIGNIVQQNDIKKKLLTTTTTTTVKVDKYSEKQKSLLEEEYDVVYIINYNDKEYKINGTIENGVVNGYLEESENIKKIVLKKDGIYEIKKEEENILELDFNVNYLNVEYVLNLIKNSSVIKDETSDIKVYKYEMVLDDNNSFIYVKTNEENIVSIEIKNDEISYVLNFDK